MFDEVGRTLDQGSRERSVQSLVATTALGGLLVATLSAGGWLTLREELQSASEEEPEIRYVEIDMAYEGPTEAPAAPPPAAARARRVSPAAKPRVRPQASTADDPPTTAETTSDAPSPPAVDGAGGSADAADAEGDARIDGPDGSGEREGCVGCEGSGSRDVSHGDLQLKRRIDPSYPLAAKALDLPEVSCLATVWIDVQGVPTRVSVADCPRLFHGVTREAMMRWRWYPLRVDGERTPARTKVRFVYRMTEP